MKNKLNYLERISILFCLCWNEAAINYWENHKNLDRFWAQISLLVSLNSYNTKKLKLKIVDDVLWIQLIQESCLGLQASGLGATSKEWEISVYLCFK